MAYTRTPNFNILKLNLISDGGKTVDIRNVVDSITIYEDLFSPGITGSIVFNESYNLPQTFPIICEETLEISFTTYSKKINEQTTWNKKLRIVGIENLVVDNESSKVGYIVHFASPHLVNNARKTLRCSYGTDKKEIQGSKIVESISTNILGIDKKQLNIEQTTFTHHLVCAGWRPIQAINWVAMNDVSTTGKQLPFIFFENADKVHFVSWDTLIGNKLIQNPIIDTITYGKTIQDKSTKIPENEVLTFKIKKIHDELAMSLNGTYGSTTITLDVLKRKFKEKQLDLTTEFSKLPLLEPTNKIPTNKRKTLPSESFRVVFDNYEYSHLSKANGNWQQHLAMLIGLSDTYLIDAEVVGNSAHRLGGVLKFKVPSSVVKTGDASKTGKDYFHQLSGKYLVTAIRHSITSTEYKQTIELRKFGQRTKTA